MPLNKLENFIKNTEGKILYVNPNDLDATDAITNQGNSLAQPFKTIQRALLESARFSYVEGNNNDIIEKTTILLFPGEHIVDNRPGFAIKNVSNTATAVSPAGAETDAAATLSLTLTSNFDLTQEDNQLYKFNSINGGVIVPRGTSIVGLDLRKTKIKPKYVPNPTDSAVPKSALFRITGTCYFWQFSIFDGDESGTVFTDPVDFSATNRSKPTFSHHKLTCFEYADGVNIDTRFNLTDLAIYYSKLSNAFNSVSRFIDQVDRFPANPLGFAPQRPEFEIVGAFASDPITISSLSSGATTPSTVVTVTTATAHGLTTNTPIKIKGVSPDAARDYNISTKVQNVISETIFTYLLPFVDTDLPANPNTSNATVTIETDTVSGASPYIFNISLRSVYGMNGMLADGNKATGFKSMVVAQFTAISLQKDDRAFVKYNPSSRSYTSIGVNKVTGAQLASGSSSKDAATVYHLDSNAVYRKGFETTHIKLSNDAVMQIVSVFAIGFNKHFNAETGADASVTNSNSNFGQFAIASDGFKKEAFSKDNAAYVTNVITPKAITSTETNIDWQRIDVGLTTSVGISSHLYLFGFNTKDNVPPVVIQGYRVGAKTNDQVFVDFSIAGVAGYGTSEASPLLVDNLIANSGTTAALGDTSSIKSFGVSAGPTNNILTLGTHTLLTGEKIRVISDTGDLPENLVENTVYFAIRQSGTQIKIASSKTNAELGTAITIYGGSKLKIESRVSDKASGDIGSPIQFDAGNSNWFIHANNNNQIYTALSQLGVGELGANTPVSFIKRVPDERSLDEKIYKLRVVVPKESDNAKNPEEGFIIQESSSTGVRAASDFTAVTISQNDSDFDRNPRFISTCSRVANTVTVIADVPHDLKIGERIFVKNVTDSTGTTAGVFNKGYNGSFLVSGIVDDKTFTYPTTDTDGVTHTIGNFTNNVSNRVTTLPRFERNNLQSNYYIYRNETINEYIKDVQDGVYHLFVLHADNPITTEFTGLKYGQNVVDLYPQLDRDNNHSNPPASASFAKRDPLGDVSTNDQRKSITRESTDKVLKDFGYGKLISGSVRDNTAGITTITFDRPHSFGQVKSVATIVSGSGLTNGVYHNVKLFNTGTTTWDGATAKVTVSSNAVSAVEIIEGGSGYTGAETLDIDNSFTGGTGAKVTIVTAGISTNIGDVIQITGIGTATDSIHRIRSLESKTQVSVAITAGDPTIFTGQFAINQGPSATITGTPVFDSTVGITTFAFTSGHGLIVGNQFRVLDTSNQNIGNFFVKNVVNPTSFSAKTTVQLTNPAHVLRDGMTAATPASDKENENIGSRGLSFFDGETFTLGANVTTGTTVQVTLPNVGVGTTARFDLGSYVQIGNEILRVVDANVTGTGNNELNVLRGSLGTIQEDHTAGEMVRKVKPLPIEFRRPSIIRASGHTFEYLGYGPGNYSTALPQVQVRTLTEREEFLTQSQERSCGTVVYTGMNNRGDFFIGNKRVSSATGQERTFDAPIPTVTGEDPSRLSVIFDEVIIKERLVVEGGKSRTILTQFDGPVTFNEVVKLNKDVTFNGEMKLNSTLEITNDLNSHTKDTGSIVTDGGVGIEKNLNVGEDFTVGGGTTLTNLNVTGLSTFIGAVDFVDGVEIAKFKVGVTTDNMLGTTSGNIIIDSAGGTTTVQDTLVVSGDFSANGATLGNIKIGVTNDNQIDTTSGALTLTSVPGTSVLVNNPLTVTGILTANNGATIDNLTISSSGGTTNLNTKSGTLTIDAVGDNVIIPSGTTLTFEDGTFNQLTGNAISLLGSPGTVSTINGGIFNNIRVGITTANMVCSSSGNIIIDSTSGTTQIDDNLTVSGNLDVNGTGNHELAGPLSVSGVIKAINADVIAFSSSDLTLKENLVKIDRAVERVNKLSGYTFDWKSDAGLSGESYDHLKGQSDIGVIAQEVEAIGLVGLTTTRPDGIKAVRYDRLVPVLIQAIKELDARVKSLGG